MIGQSRKTPVILDPQKGITIPQKYDVPNNEITVQNSKKKLHVYVSLVSRRR